MNFFFFRLLQSIRLSICVYEKTTKLYICHSYSHTRTHTFSRCVHIFLWINNKITLFHKDKSHTCTHKTHTLKQTIYMFIYLRIAQFETIILIFIRFVRKYMSMKGPKEDQQKLNNCKWRCSDIGFNQEIKEITNQYIYTAVVVVSTPTKCRHNNRLRQSSVYSDESEREKRFFFCDCWVHTWPCTTH